MTQLQQGYDHDARTRSTGSPTSRSRSWRRASRTATPAATRTTPSPTGSWSGSPPTRTSTWSSTATSSPPRSSCEPSAAVAGHRRRGPRVRDARRRASRASCARRRAIAKAGIYDIRDPSRRGPAADPAALAHLRADGPRRDGRGRPRAPHRASRQPRGERAAVRGEARRDRRRQRRPPPADRPDRAVRPAAANARLSLTRMTEPADDPTPETPPTARRPRRTRKFSLPDHHHEEDPDDKIEAFLDGPTAASSLPRPAVAPAARDRPPAPATEWSTSPPPRGRPPGALRPVDDHPRPRPGRWSPPEGRTACP